MTDTIQIRIKKTHLKLAGLMAAVWAIVVVSTAIAAYLGPNRDYTTTSCNLEWTGTFYAAVCDDSSGSWPV